MVKPSGLGKRNQPSEPQSGPTIALLPWGDVWEDFYGSIGVSFESFCHEMTGGWQFGYIDALKQAGVRTVLIYTSTHVTAPSRFIHTPTGATICVLPVPRTYRVIRRYMVHPHPSLVYCESLEDLFGNVPDRYRALFKTLRYISPYLTTPLGLLARELRREGCHAILCQEYEYARFDTCVLLGKLLNLPVFASFQGGNWEANRIGHCLRPLATQKCSGLIIGTQTEIQRVQNSYSIPPSKIAKIFNPIDLRLWKPIERNEARAMFSLPVDAKVVVWHGRISLWTKGLDILLEAWEQVCTQRKGEDLRLLLMGTGQETAELRQRIANLPLQNVIWIDRYVNDRTFICHFLSTGNVYAFPSRHEGFPVAPIEAMACGLPVVAAAAPGVPDIFEGGKDSGGIVVSKNDVAAFAEALGCLLDDAVLAHELGQRARRRVEKVFSLEEVGRQLRNFLFQDRLFNKDEIYPS